MRTAVRRILLLSALMSPGMLHALGLGDIRLNSALNQPFDAEIELVSATQDDLGALRASLASGETFTRYGLDRPSYLSDFSFRVSKAADGRDVLRVTSPRPVTEPFVTLLVEANWPRGRLLREYTVLLDPPVYAPGPAEAAAPAVAAPRVSSGGATSVRVAEPVAAETATAEQPDRTQSAPAVTRMPGIEPGTTYQVRPNDTLYRIASAAHPGTRSDINRAMVSIYQQNPTAFEGNINVLHAGSALRIPQAAEVASVSAAAATAEVARQYDDWRAGRTGAGATAPAADAGRLRLVTPDQGTTTPSAATAPSAAPGGAVAGAAAGNLEARVQQLEAELAEARRLLEVRNAELATLQGGAAAAVEPGTEVAVTPEAADAGATTAEPPAVAKPAAKPEAAKPEPQAKPTAKEPEPGLLQRLGQYWWALLALLALLGAALLFKRMRRQRGSAEASLEEALAARDLRSARAQLTTRPREGGIVVEEKRAAEPSRTAPAAAAVAATAQRAPETTRKPVTIEDTLSGDGPASIESGDPLAEADFHMAYGLYDQAADLVQLAMKREPQRRDLKLKLLEIFFVWGNRDRFLQLAREMNSSRGEAAAGEWDKILIMGKQIAPEDALFTGVPRASADSLDMELHSSTQTLDMDLPAGDSPMPDLDLSNSETVLADTSGLDFVFDEPAGRASDDSTISPTIETTARVRRSGAEIEDTAFQTARMRRTGEETEEIPVESLGLELDSLHSFPGLDGDDELTAEERRVGVDNERTVESPRVGVDNERTVESPRVAVDDTAERTQIQVEEEDIEDDLDLINSTALIKMSEDTAAMLQQADESETGVIDLSDATGEMPTIETPELTSRDLRVVKSDYGLPGEPATMSEVGTKLDLARAYMDMGDPEGARSILDEVLQEGSPVQKQEAERLIASLP